MAIKNGNIHFLEQRIRSFEYEETLGLRKQFLSNGFVLIKGLVPAGALEEIDEECSRIMRILGSDKDLLMEETQNTPRHMRTVGQHRLAQESSLIPSIYESDIFRGFLIAIAGQELFKAPWLPEQYILSHLYREGDTHFNMICTMLRPIVIGQTLRLNDNLISNELQTDLRRYGEESQLIFAKEIFKKDMRTNECNPIYC